VKREDAEELTQAVGQSVSGAWRTIAGLQKLGVPKALGLSDREWVQKRLGGYVKLAVTERYEADDELKAKGHGLRQISAATGVDTKTLMKDRRDRGVGKSHSDPKKDKGKRTASVGNSHAAPLDAVAGLAKTLATSNADWRRSRRWMRPRRFVTRLRLSAYMRKR
jgi:hypothetical protein